MHPLPRWQTPPCSSSRLRAPARLQSPHRDLARQVRPVAGAWHGPSRKGSRRCAVLLRHLALIGRSLFRRELVEEGDDAIRFLRRDARETKEIVALEIDDV